MAKRPALKARAVVRALERAGFQLIRQKGSHMIFDHPLKPHLRVTVPDHGSNDLKPATLSTILKQAEMTIDQLVALLS